jgi:hypothetical protein
MTISRCIPAFETVNGTYFRTYYPQKGNRNLTDYGKLNALVRYPAWSPNGNQIIYEYSETTGNVWVADLK